MANIIVSSEQSLAAILTPELSKSQKAIQALPSGIRVVADPMREPKPDGWTRFVCFSDTHGLHGSIPAKHCPAADVLIHAGDITNCGEHEQLESFSEWLASYPAEQKIVIAGNHDITLHEEYYRQRGAKRFHCEAHYDSRKTRSLLQNCVYLEDSGIEVLGYQIFGSPWQPEFCDWAFQMNRGELHQRWDRIPTSVDILITHTPPASFGDRTSSGARVGCAELGKAIEQREVSVNISGHIHDSYGCSADSVTLYINASTCDHHYRPINAPIVFDAPPAAEIRTATAQAAAKRRQDLDLEAKQLGKAHNQDFAKGLQMV